MDMYEQVGINIKKYMEDSGETIESMSIKLSMHKQMLEGMINGQVGINVADVIKIAEILEVEFDSLLDSSKMKY